MSLKEKKIYPAWDVTITGGKVVFDDREGFDRYLIAFEGKKKKLIIKDVSKDRSRQEEKFYHAVVVRYVAEAMDISDQEAHEFLKKMFLSIEERSPAGFRYMRVMSTTELSDKAYSDYWKRIQRWAVLPTLDDGLGPESGLGLYIPDPNEVEYDYA